MFPSSFGNVSCTENAFGTVYKLLKGIPREVRKLLNSISKFEK
jgi:hypothetical protein